MIGIAVIVQSAIHPAYFFPAMKNTKATQKMEKKAAKKAQADDSDPEALELRGN